MILYGGIGPNGMRRGDVVAFDFGSSAASFIDTAFSETWPCLVTKKWTTVSTTGANPPPRWGHSAVIYEDKMYVFGGYVDTFQNDLFQLDLSE